jgi:hypothetical protein
MRRHNRPKLLLGVSYDDTAKSSAKHGRVVARVSSYDDSFWIDFPTAS